jgi:cysteine desulfurase
MAAPAPIYLDHAAATPLHPDVAEVIAKAQATAFANPSSQHAAGRAARRMLEDSRERILALLGCHGGVQRDRLVFTSGASEANHLAILGMAAAMTPDVGTDAGCVFFSRRDHPSAIHAAMAAERRGWRREELPLDAATGRVSSDAGATLLFGPTAAEGPRIVSLTLVCGQTGSLEDLSAFGGHAPDTLVHLDATQAAGLLPLDVPRLPVATLCLAPHKFGGPRGIGGLVVKSGVPLAAIQAGTQEQGLRGGTEPAPLAAGFARSLELAVADRDREAVRLAGLRDRLESGLVAAARRAGIEARAIAAAARCPHVTTIAFPGLDRQALAMAADLAGVCLATGTACTSGSSEPAPALVAMGLEPEAIRGAVRLSVGRTTTAADVEEAIARLTPLLRPPA